MTPSDELLREHCNRCLRITKHRLVGSHQVIDTDDDGAPVYEQRYLMLECCGCEDVCLRHTMFDHPSQEERAAVYPPRIARPRPKWLVRLPKGVPGVLDEVYVALQNNSPRLAMMGARTAIDMLATDQVGDVGSFGKKLEALEKKGVISSKSREYLFAAFDAGSAAAHRGHLPTPVDVSQVMDIVENVLQNVYVLESAAGRLKRRTPARRSSSPV